MKKKWCLALALTSLSLNVIAGEYKTEKIDATAELPQSPFSIDRKVLDNNNVIQPEVSKVNEGISITLKEGSLLSQEFKSWASAQNYKLLWNSDKDYIIYREVKFHGRSKEDILQSLGKFFSSEQYGLVLKLYTGNNVLLIDSQ